MDPGSIAMKGTLSLFVRSDNAKPKRVFRALVLKTLLLAVAVWSVALIQSCASTAVKGTPVKDLSPITGGVGVKKIPKSTKIEELAMMAKVKGNKVFLEIDGIAEYRVGPLDVLEISSHVGSEVSRINVTVDNRGRILSLIHI